MYRLSSWYRELENSAPWTATPAVNVDIRDTYVPLHVIEDAV